MLIYDNEYQTKENQNWTKDKIELKHLNFFLDNNESVSGVSTEDIDYAPMPPESALFVFSATNMWVV